MKRLSLMGFLLTLGLAGASYAPPLTLAQQAVKAEVIVRATIGTATSVQEGGQSWTVYPLTVAETLAGDAQSLPQYQSKPSIWVLNGLQDGPVVSAGEVMLLLYRAKYDSPVVGFNQGLYPVSGAATSRVVSNLPAGTPGAAVAPAVTPASPAAPATVSPATVPPASAAPPADAASPAPAPPASAVSSPPVVSPAPVPPASPVAESTPDAATPPVTPPAPLAPASPPAAATPASTLQPGQMTLEAFRQAVLKARAGGVK